MHRNRALPVMGFLFVTEFLDLRTDFEGLGVGIKRDLVRVGEAGLGFNVGASWRLQEEKSRV